ncbi:MAG TPA: V-type ATP synthase subunit E, partial [Clostridiales bacterium]|nr:V-type ATP synthase subunit E [Clostridiales bacterium]
EENSDKACENIIGNAKREADSIIAEAKEQALAIEQEAERLAKDKVAAVESRAYTGSKQKAGRVHLAARNEAIAKCMEGALEKLKALPIPEYFDVLIRLAKKYAEPGKCSVHFNKLDIGRMPSGFEKELTEALSELGCQPTLSKEPVDITGGFVLVYGDIEINCSFDALAEGNSEELKELIYKNIF